METLVRPQPFIPSHPVCPPVTAVASFSRFSFFTKPIESKQPAMEFSLADAYNYIRSGVSAQATARLRSLPSTQRPAFKRSNFDFCTFSGLFQQRKAEKLIRHSYLVCFDFDHLSDVEAVALTLLNDPYFETMLLFRSPSGDGLKWVVSMEQNYAYRERFFPVETPASYHPLFFYAVQHYLHTTYSLDVDEKCKDVSRACFLPFDPNAYINPALS